MTELTTPAVRTVKVTEKETAVYIIFTPYSVPRKEGSPLGKCPPIREMEAQQQRAFDRTLVLVNIPVKDIAKYNWNLVKSLVRV